MQTYKLYKTNVEIKTETYWIDKVVDSRTYKPTHMSFYIISDSLTYVLQHIIILMYIISVQRARRKTKLLIITMKLTESRDITSSDLLEENKSRNYTDRGSHILFIRYFWNGSTSTPGWGRERLSWYPRGQLLWYSSEELLQYCLPEELQPSEPDCVWRRTMLRSLSVQWNITWKL